ncbi:MAG: hypothetical protein S4CHLAM6_10240 [Chlamydiae bacterium]|nr:hypothetical protein [Chlamydiota bacterium]
MSTLILDQDFVNNNENIKSKVAQLPELDPVAMEKISIESEQRRSRRTTMEVLQYEPSDKSASNHLVWAGSVGVFVAKKGSKTLKRIIEAVRTNNGEDVIIAKEIADTYASRPMLSHQEAVDLAISQDSFADVSYGGRLLFYNATVVEGVDVCAIGLPYNGGRIYPEAFELIEHYANESADELEGVVLYRPQKLSTSEANALSSLNEDDEWYNIGKHFMCFAASAVTVFATVCAATAACCHSASFTKRGLVNPHVQDDLAKKLDSITTAKELLKLRRDILCS